jgi:hypothetical protein
MRISILFFVLFLAAVQCRAQDKVELFGSYSYVRGAIEVRPATPAIPCPPNCTPPALVTQHANLNGWNLSGTYKLGGTLGLATDFSGHYGTLNGGSAHLNTFLLGPQLSYPGRVSPFIHALFGGAHESVAAFSTAASSSAGTDTNFASAIGGGIDMKASPLVSFRLIQIDYLYTHLYGRSQSQPRVSAGIVLHFQFPSRKTIARGPNHSNN